MAKSLFEETVSVVNLLSFTCCKEIKLPNDNRLIVE